MRADELTEQIIGAAIAVHRELGPGLLESIYQAGMAIELRLRRLDFIAEARIPIHYRGIPIEGFHRIDFLVEDTIVVELKAVERLDPVHTAQLLTYLRLSGKSLGLLLNFNSATLKDGIRRLALGPTP
jgi:GxxExxY protein